ncbi:uncharacterized protein LOC129612577 [Condylostylus longicornis]|uniref:uncharacterized protein LOC129605985 n=1 Tax=Condylostylus longicornis TaxID=2530218 RepID=UPI00244DC191|nr:uncharacterized protein LOC129605985 [Condylostylus longicornis]XP_055382221.1 uncharacterized protein LOC129612577 [Condylostylus longicornis]
MINSVVRNEMPSKYIIKKPPLSKPQLQWYKILLAHRVGLKPRELKRRKSQIYYSDICALRYSKKRSEYTQQICQEIENLEMIQPTAMQAMRFHRLFSITTLWPPLFSKSDIQWTINTFDDFISRKDRWRIEKVLNGGNSRLRF